MQTLYNYFNQQNTLSYNGKPYNSRILIKKLNIRVCPYCNRNFIYNVDNKQRTSEFDHFYPQTKYPYLAMSFYNLIPSCKVCNFLKKDRDLKVNPYDERFDKQRDFSFGFVPKNSSFLYLEKSIRLKVDFKKNRNEISHDMKTLELCKLYANHKDIVLEIIQKAEMYNDSYIDELLQKYEGSLFKNREDLMRLLFGGYISDDEIGKRPLSKLTKDILEQLEIV